MKYAALILLVSSLFSCRDCEKECKDICTEMAMEMPPVTVDLPESSESNTKHWDEAMEVSVMKAEGEIRYQLEDQLMNFETFSSVLEEEAVQRETSTIKIAGEKDVPYEAVFIVIDLCKDLDLKPVLLFQD